MGARDLFAPLVLATMLNVVSFGLIWRGYQYERAKQKTPFAIELFFFAYLFLMCGTGYLFLNNKLSGRLELFAAGIVCEAMAFCILYGLAEGFWLSREKPLRRRLFPMVASTFLTAIMIGAALT